MRRSLSWAICGMLCYCTSVATAQQYSPIKPNYGRSAKRVATNTLPSPASTMAVGTGIGQSSIGTHATAPAVHAPTATPHVPSYSYDPAPASTHNSYSSAPATTYSAPSYPAATASDCATGNCYGSAHGSSVGYNVGAACNSCGSSTCLGGCKHGKLGKLGSLSSLLGKRHCGGGAAGGWFGGLYYINLWRSDDNFGHPLAFDSANPTTTVLATGQARMQSSSGLGVRFGKMLSGNSAVEVIYWQVFPDDQTAIADAAVIGNPVTSSIDFNSLAYDNLGGGGAVPVNDFFTDAQSMSVTRSFDYRNFEINFLKLPFVYGGNPNSRARVALLAGARYFQATEELEFFSDDLNNVRGDDPANELKLKTELYNHLVGFQLGCLFDYQFTCRLSGQLGSKVGIYNNHMRHVQSVTGDAGGADITAGPNAGQTYGLDTKKDDVAFLGEIDAGLAYCLNSNWRLSGGYKLLALSGYANPTKQLPRSFDDLGAAGLIHNDDSLILHGAYVGAEYCW